MKWASAASERPTLEDALREAADAVDADLGADPPDLLLVFSSEQHRRGWDRVLPALRARFPRALPVGCSAHSVIGGGRELEEGPGLSLTAAVLPGVQLQPFHLSPHDDPRECDTFIRVRAEDHPHFLLLPDPFSFDTEVLVRVLDERFPASVKLGGLASGGRRPGENALFLGEHTYRGGLVGVALCGDVELDTVVAQGCRPIGLPMFVTRCQSHLLQELDGRLPVEILQEVFDGLGPEDRRLFQTSLFLGVEMTPARNEYRQGDFLIRNLVGLDAENGALAVAAHLHTGQVVQLHLRDARTSAEDLSKQLARYRSTAPPGAAQGALLFSCLGRGLHLYGEPNHDSSAFRRHVGDLPLGGFFCNGEIGPVQGKTFLHGYTSAFGVFRPRGAGS